MTILAETTGWAPIMTNVLLVVHVVVCILLCLVVLMQRPKQEGLGAAFGGGMTDQAFGARTTDVLQKGTVYLASILFVVTLVLSILVGSKSSSAGISEEIEKNGVAAIEDNGDAAAAAAAAADNKLSTEAIVEGMKEAVAEDAAGVSDPVTPVAPDAPADPATETPAVPETPADPADPAPEIPADPTNSGQ